MFARFVVLTALVTSSVACRATAPTDGPSSKVMDAESGLPAQVHRFSAWLDILRESVEESSDVDAAADELIGGMNRVAAFNLQALGRLYESDDEFFKKFRKTFKKLEDAIGEYDKWDKILEKAEDNGASNSVISGLKDKRKKARKSLRELLKEEGYHGDAPLLTSYAERLRTYEWAVYDTDKTAMLDRLAGALEAIAATEWDFAHLEEGNGVHEFRREIRWFLIETRVLNGMVLLKPLDSDCPASVYAALPSQPIAASKYGKLPPSDTEVAPVSITPCLFLALVSIVEEVGQLKDDSEVDNNDNGGDATDTVEPAIRARIEALYQEMMDNEVLGTLAQELREGMPQ
jgi:hypothetical protein